MGFSTKDVVNFLGQTALFKGCEPGELSELVETAHQQKFKAGSTILSAGKPVPGLGVVLKGKASIVLIDAASGKRTVIEQLQPGGFFGEVGLLLGSGNPQSVIADEDCDAIIVAKNDIERLFLAHAQASLALAQRISSRFVQFSVLGLRASTAQVVEQKAPTPEPEPVGRGAQLEKGQIPWVDMAEYRLTPEILQMIPATVIRKHRLLPLKLRDKTLTVGMVNPKSVEALQELRRTLHTVDPEVVAISLDDWSQTFVRLKLDAGSGKPQAGGMSRALKIDYAADQEKDAEKAQLFIGNEVVKLLDTVLMEATEMGASDIHVEPESAGVKIRFRVHGMLQDRKEFVAPSYAQAIIARIKVLAELDITERRLPQDGRIMAQMGRQELNLRVSTIPVARGEKAVIRVIDSADAMRPLHQIVLNPAIEKAMRSSLAQPFGAIVVAGPTGSGKSSTLYSMLSELKKTRPDSALVTVEDPVEYLLQGVTQVPVIPKVDFGFAQALKGLMRQDPDIIMVGELRDSETSTIMVEAALTGHLVLTSIHGNHAAAVVQRLQHLGTNPVLLSQALSIIVVQRLSKRLCPNCVGEGDVAPALLENLVERRIVANTGSMKLPRPVGCEACGMSGYLGRIAVQEIMDLDDVIRGALADEASPSDLVALAKERGRFHSFAQTASFLMARRQLSPADALLIVAD